MINYNEYALSAKQYIMSLLIACACTYMIGTIFFKSIWISVALALLGFLYPKFRRKELMKKRLNELSVQFKQALYILASSLAAGKSIESAFIASHADLEPLFPDKNTYIRREFNFICRRLENGESIETILIDFGKRTGLEDIQSFADVFMICKRTGGNLVEVMRHTANMIGEKIAIQQEIAVMVAQKRFESKVLSVAPLLFVAILSFTSADYMAPLYEGTGLAIMGGALIVLAGCTLLSKKLMEIKV